MTTYVRIADVDNPTKVAIMKDAREASRKYTMDKVSQMLITCLIDVGYHPDDSNKSGFQFLEEVLNECFTDGLPGVSANYFKQLQRLDVEQFYAWLLNLDIMRAVNQALLYAERV